MLQVEQLSVEYDHNPVLQALDFQIADHELLAVLGPSGVGKTTLINAICQRLPYQGSIALDGEAITPRTQRLALVPQDYGLLPWLTVRDNVALPLRLHHRQAAAKATAMLAALGLAALAERYPAALSGGQQQRVALARAFIDEPQLLLLDEAFSALDPVVKQKAYALFIAQWEDQPVTTMMVTHDLEEALVLSDRLLVLVAGGGVILPNPLATIPRAKRRQSATYPATLANLQEEVMRRWGD